MNVTQKQKKFGKVKIQTASQAEEVKKTNKKK